MKIKINSKDNTFIRRDIVQNMANLSSLGLLIYMCSFPDNFIFNKEDLREEAKLSKSSFDEAINYLISEGYAKEQNTGFIHIINEE
jgi:hypothetical protein